MQYVEIKCECGFSMKLEPDYFQVKRNDFNVRVVSENIDDFKRFTCNLCIRGRLKYVYNDRDVLLFDLGDIKECGHCGNPIPVARMKAVPGTSVCTDCARKGFAGVESRPSPLHDDELLVEQKKIKKCVRCGRQIRPGRVAMLPETDICSSCASMGPMGFESPRDYEICPECGAPSAMRRNRWNGTRFLGCSTYPKCAWTRNIRDI